MLLYNNNLHPLLRAVREGAFFVLCPVQDNHWAWFVGLTAPG